MTDKSLIELEQKIVAYGDEREAGGVGFGNDADALLSEIRQRLAVVPSVPETGDWGIDLSTGRKILVYKNCSVIEDAQAELVLSLLAAAPQSPAIAAERVAELEALLHEAYSFVLDKGNSQLGERIKAAIAKAGERVSLDNGGEG